jgi:hypothetical protein
MKGIIRRLRPSPAMVIACIALVFAMTGAGYAAGMLGPNTVGTKQLKKNAVISSKVKNRSLLAVDFKSGQLPRGAQGPQGTQGAQGPQGPQGVQGPAGPGARWAVVQPNGTIVLQSGGITSTHTGTGTYRLDFGSDVSRQLILVSPGPAADFTFRGIAISGSCAPPAGSTTLIGCNVATPETKVFVGTLNQADTALEDHSFYVTVMGPTGAAGAGPARPDAVSHGPLAGK